MLVGSRQRRAAILSTVVRRSLRMYIVVSGPPRNQTTSADQCRFGWLPARARAHSHAGICHTRRYAAGSHGERTSERPVAFIQVRGGLPSVSLSWGREWQRAKEAQGAVLLTVGRSYVGNDVTHSTLVDRARACSYENLPKYRSNRVSNTAPWASLVSWHIITI